MHDLKRVFFAALVCMVLPCTSWSASTLSEDEKIAIYRQDVKRIEAYLNAIKTMVSPFKQVSSDGALSTGFFYLERPGRLRWDYETPSKVVIIVKGALVTYYDAELDQISHVPIDDTLGGFLTKEHISFRNSKDEVEVMLFEKRDGKIFLQIAEEDEKEKGNVTLIFGDNESAIELLGMKVVDATGLETSVEFLGHEYGKPVDKSLFSSKALRKGR